MGTFRKTTRPLVRRLNEDCNEDHPSENAFKNSISGISDASDIDGLCSGRQYSHWLNFQPNGKKHRGAICYQLDAVCLLSDVGKEIDRRGTNHISFRIGYPAWLVTPCHNDLNPFVRTYAQGFDRIAID